MSTVLAQSCLAPTHLGRAQLSVEAYFISEKFHFFTYSFPKLRKLGFHILVVLSRDLGEKKVYITLLDKLHVPVESFLQVSTLQI